MANVEEPFLDLATIVAGNVGQLVPAGREVSDVYIAEMPVGAPVMLMIGLNAAAGFRNLQQGDSFDCLDRQTCKGETEGIGVKVLSATAGTFRVAVTYGGGASLSA
jgi:hypothetical protein